MLTRKAIPSPNYSSRGGATVRLLVIHTAEGARTIEELGSYFQGDVDASSHVGIDDTPNTVAVYVRREYKAWTAAGANPVAVQAELCAFAGWTAADWQQHPEMLHNCAKWLAEEAAATGVPLRKLTPTEAQGSGRGVCQHADLGSWGGGHWDCGSSFPLDQVLKAANGETEEDEEMGYPAWFWDWVNWYLTTDRDPGSRPAGVPETIPDWAWDGQKEVAAVGGRYGMTAGERDWIDWNAAGKKAERPDVPDTIPDRWWDDNKWAADR